jgi:hypothetical protein
MRRAEAIFLIALLLALPLALLTGGGSAPSMCDAYCCLPHAHHSAQMQQPSHQMGNDKSSEEMSCHRGAAGHFLDCSMKSNSRGMDYSILTPLAPTNLSSSAALLLLLASRRVFVEFSQDTASGYLSAPFEPPRA